MFLKIAHRGASAYAPENTLSAFQKALELGADMIELDVHLAKTGEVMVIHDETVDRTTNEKGLVQEKTLAELKKLKINQQEKIPTLREVLDLVNKQMKVNIELKNQETVLAVNEIIREYIFAKNWKISDFLISSFDFKILKNFKKINPEIRLGLLIEDEEKNFLAKAKEINAWSINLSEKLINQEIVNAAHMQGLKVLAWTVNNSQDFKKIKDLMVDGIFSDFPDKI